MSTSAGANDKLWLLDLERMNLSRLTGGPGNDGAGALSQDGRWVVFSSDRAGGVARIYRMPLDGSAAPVALLDREARLDSFSYPSGMIGLTMASDKDQRDHDAYVLSLAADGTAAGPPRLVAGGAGDQGQAAVSPDGALVAYVVSESREGEVFIARLSDPSSRRRLTTGGGTHPQWNRSGTRLFYLGTDAIYFLPLLSAQDLRFGAPERVVAAGPFDWYDVGLDGTSVLVPRLEDSLMLRREIRLRPGWGRTVADVR